MNKILTWIACVVALATLFLVAKPQKYGDISTQFNFTSASIATSSIGTAWTANPVVTLGSQTGYASFCNDSTTSNSGIYLGLGATTTGVSGIKILSGNCYEMYLGKAMFWGKVYAIASSATSTLLTVIK